ncbi:MAG: oligoribonuclease [Micrococcaceae bacterium]
MSTIKDPIVWMDCEMTGLNVEQDSLIEVSVLITDSELNIVDTKGLDVVIKADKPAAVENMDDIVTAMHTKSGLINEIKDGLDLDDAQKEVLSYIKKYISEPGIALLAGNSVGMDKAFLQKYMPEVIAYLHYRILDVSTIKELTRRWYPDVYNNAPEKAEGHRALADIFESIQELKFYRNTIFVPEPGPSVATLQEINKKYSQ